MKFGQYELLELIAVGGMAEVYKGRVVGAEGFEKYVAIKRILPDLGEDERFVKMLLTEARIHSALSHRNIVQIHDLGISEDGEYFIVLEYVEGYDLRMILDQISAQGEIMPEALSLHIAAELAQGLHFAHEQRGADGQPLGLVHRDVSPSNVLISMAGEVKLSDFGLAKRRHDQSVVGSLKGNLAYMSPEQARQSSLDRRTDVFSLGAVLFEMLTGRRLREITNEVEGWGQVASGVVASARNVRPDLPESFGRVLERALAANPEGRFADAAAFGTAIRGLLAQMHTPVGASDLQSLLSALSPPRRPRSLIERSKVIRLGPEAQALREAIDAPETPPPLVAPGLTPRVPARAGAAVVMPAEFADPTPGFDESPATPPPLNPLPPVRRRIGTPPMPVSLGRVPQPVGGGPIASAPQDVPVGRRRVETAPLRAGGAPPVWASSAGAAAAAVRTWQEPVAQVTEPVPTFAAASRPRRETARLHASAGPAGMWRPLVVAVAAILILAASAVHFAVIPLDVLATWRRPVTLFVATEPEGASVKVDGVALVEPAPTQTTVRRDRLDHVIEVARPGYRPTREIIRFDRAVVLSFVIRLQQATKPVLDTASPAVTH